MKKIVGLFFAAVLLAALPARAQQQILPCVQIPGVIYNSCDPVSSTNPLPVAVYSGAGVTSGFVLTANAPGTVATFQAATGGGGSPGGAHYNIQLNNGASGFAGSASLTSDVANDLFAAGGIGIGTSSLTVGTALDLGSNTNSLLLPAGTTGQRPSPTAGMLRYNSTVPQVEAYYSGAWNALGGGSGSVSVTASTPNVIINPSPGTGTFTVGFSEPINAQTTTTPYAVQGSTSSPTDMGKTITHNKTTAVS